MGGRNSKTSNICESAFLYLILWNCNGELSSLPFLPTAKRYHGIEDDNSLLLIFSHCLIQLDSKAIPSLKHTEHTTFATLDIIKHNKDYKSCLIQCLLHSFKFVTVLKALWPLEVQSDTLFLVSTQTSRSTQAVSALAGWPNTGLLSEIQNQSRWMLPLPMQSGTAFQCQGRLHSFHSDYKLV